jgi:hypothetical protein
MDKEIKKLKTEGVELTSDPITKYRNKILQGACVDVLNSVPAVFGDMLFFRPTLQFAIEWGSFTPKQHEGRWR